MLIFCFICFNININIIIILCGLGGLACFLYKLMEMGEMILWLQYHPFASFLDS